MNLLRRLTNFENLVLAMFAGFTAIATPAVAVTTVFPPSSAQWSALRRDDLRVATVAYRLSIANRALCLGETAPQAGFVLHGIEQYSPGERRAAARNFGLGSLVGVMAVVPGSPAARAGMTDDDQMVAVNGRDLRPLLAASGAPSNAQVRIVWTTLMTEMARGAVTLRVKRAGGSRDVSFTPETGCPANVELIPDRAVNAWADGHAVVVSEGLLRLCDHDGDLALVIAHEMSHNLLHHAARLARAPVAINALLGTTGAGSAEMRATEEEADRLGVYLAMAAAFDLRGAVPFLRGALAGGPPGQLATTHPSTARRLELLTADIAG